MNLTQASRTFHNIIKFGWLIIFFPAVVAIIFKVITPSGPGPGGTPTAPTYNAAFGKLPQLTIEDANIPASTPAFALDLISATFPANPGVINVFPVLSAPYGFLSQDRARALGETLHFDNEPTTIDNTILEWHDRLRTLRMTISNLNFKYTFNYRLDPSVFGLNVFASEEFAVNEATRILEDFDIYDGSLAPDLKAGTHTSQQYRYNGVQIEQSSTLFNTGAVRVDYFRPDINDIPLVSPNYYQALVNITISSKKDDPTNSYYPKILELNYSYWKYDTTKIGTYPLINAEDAYALLKQDASTYLVFVGDAENPLDLADEPITKLTTRNVELAYYNSANYVQYLQPIWVFTGRATLQSGKNDEFVAYVPAVRSDWTQ